MNINKLFILIVCLVSFTSCNSPELQQASNLIGDSNNLTNPSLPPVVNEFTKILRAAKATVGLRADGTISCIHSAKYCAHIDGKTNVKNIITNINSNSFIVFFNDDHTECFGDSSSFNAAACNRSNVKDFITSYNGFVFLFNDGTLECSGHFSSCPSGAYDSIKSHVIYEDPGNNIFSAITSSGNLTIFGDSTYNFTPAVYNNVKNYNLNGSGDIVIHYNDDTLDCIFSDRGPRTNDFNCSTNSELNSNISSFYSFFGQSSSRLVIINKNGNLYDLRCNTNGGCTTTPQLSLFSSSEALSINKISYMNEKYLVYESNGAPAESLDVSNNFLRESLPANTEYVQSLGQDMGYITYQGGLVKSYHPLRSVELDYVPQEFIDSIDNNLITQVIAVDPNSQSSAHTGFLALSKRNTVFQYTENTNFWFEQKLNY